MKPFTHGIMAIDSKPDEEDNVRIVHFIGLWNEPTYEEFLELSNEIKNTPEFGLSKIIDRVVILPATEEVIEQYNVGVSNYEAKNN